MSLFPASSGSGKTYTYYSNSYTSGTAINCGFLADKAWVYLNVDSNTRTLMFEVDFTTNTMLVNYLYSGSAHRDSINSLNYNNGYFIASRNSTSVTFSATSGTYFSSGFIDVVVWKE